jgi:hypothetical protein
VATVPVSQRTLLVQIAHEFRHVREEHRRMHAGGRGRRRDQLRLDELEGRFERIVAEWIDDEALRERWRLYLHSGGEAPAEPAADIHPLVYRGASDAGSIVELRTAGESELEVWIDGVLAERTSARAELRGTGPPAQLDVGGVRSRETFGAPTDALHALNDFVSNGGRPPWEHASALVSDGLVDDHFALTPRGHRALHSRGR